MKEEERELLKKIRAHLADIHDKWQNDPNKDGHCKSSEGYVSVTAHYPNWHECGDKKSYMDAKPHYSIAVYSYLFGPSRLHEYSSFEEAWDAVKEWNYDLEPPLSIMK